MTFTEIRKWVHEEMADAVIEKAAQLLASTDVDADDIHEITKQRTRILKFLHMEHKAPSGTT